MNTQPHSPNDHCYCFPLDKPNQRPESKGAQVVILSLGVSLWMWTHWGGQRMDREASGRMEENEDSSLCLIALFQTTHTLGGKDVVGTTCQNN